MNMMTFKDKAVSTCTAHVLVLSGLFLGGCLSVRPGYNPTPVPGIPSRLAGTCIVLRAKDSSDGVYDEGLPFVSGALDEELLPDDLAEAVAAAMRAHHVFDRVQVSTNSPGTTGDLHYVCRPELRKMKVRSGTYTLDGVRSTLGRWQEGVMQLDIELFKVGQSTPMMDYSHEVQLPRYRIDAHPGQYRSRLEQAYGKLIAMQMRDFEQQLDRVLSPPVPRVPSTDPDASGTHDAWALVVGIAEYAKVDTALPNLVFADDDARAMSGVLRGMGWDADHVKVLVDREATKAGIEGALDGWLTKAGTNDLILLYWSGHAYPDPADQRKVYFACHDTVSRQPHTGWRMDRVLDRVREKGARNVVVIADTCHAGRLIVDGARGLELRPVVQKPGGAEQIPKGWIYLVSAEADRKALENAAWKNGAFTHCLLRGLKGEADSDRNGDITMLELTAFLGRAMPEATEKVLGKARTPVIESNPDDSAIWRLTLQRN
jgi:hypothetical protein